MTVVPLYTRADLIPDAAALMRQTWPDHYGPDGTGDAQTDLQGRCQTTGLPYGLLAVEGDSVVGLAALDVASCGSMTDETPWLVGLCVAASHRRQGIASQIVQAASAQAKAQGYQTIFATTQNAVGLLTRAGWQDLRGYEDATGAWRVLKQGL